MKSWELMSNWYCDEKKNRVRYNAQCKNNKYFNLLISYDIAVKLTLLSNLNVQ